MEHKTIFSLHPKWQWVISAGFAGLTVITNRETRRQLIHATYGHLAVARMQPVHTVRAKNRQHDTNSRLQLSFCTAHARCSSD